MSAAKYLIPGTAAALLGLSIARGIPSAGAQARRYDQLRRQRSRMLWSPMPDWTVKESSMSHKTVTASMSAFMQGLKGQAKQTGSKIMTDASGHAIEGVSRALGQELIAKPIHGMFAAAKNRFFEEPKRRKVYEQVVGQDPMLAEALEQNPERLMAVHESLKRFAPSLAMDPNVTRTFLREAMMGGGELNFNTAKMLADTERTLRDSRR